MNERPNASLVERLRKLLTKTTEAGCTTAEAESAFAMASRMMAQHNLSMDDVRAASGETCESFMDEPILETGRWSLEDNLVYGIIKEFFFVEGFFTRHSNSKVFTLFGTSSNVATAKFTWNCLQAAFNRQWMIYKITNRVAASERRMFVTGMAGGFSAKMRDERKAMQMERDIVRGSQGGTSLALRNINAEITKKLQEVHPELQRGNTRTSVANGSQSSLDAGYAAGKSLNINRGVGHSPGRKAIS